MTNDGQKSSTIVMIPGTRWGDTQGTDHRLAEIVARSISVLWVDPLSSVVGRAPRTRPKGLRRYYLDSPVPGLTRLRILGPPGFTRPGVRTLATAIQRWAIRSVLDSQNLEVIATVLLSPRDGFLPGVSGKRLLHVTDDWVAGATMMGLRDSAVQERLVRNAGVADTVTAVSPHLASLIQEQTGRGGIRVLANGCTVAPTAVAETGGNGSVVLLGQLNERLDIDLIEQIVDAGFKLEVVGPRRDHDPGVARRLDQVLSRRNVTWHGEVDPSRVPALIAGASVGITPYLDNEFNRSSFPLKTLDYLAAGLPVISTDTPSARWLNEPGIKVSQTHSEFLDLLSAATNKAMSAVEREALRDVARNNSWPVRAQELMRLAGYSK